MINFVKHTIILSFFVCLFFLISEKGHGQEYSHAINNSANNVFMFTFSYGNVRVESYSGNTIVVKSNNYTEPPERARGLKPLSGMGTDNTGIGLTVEERDKQLSMSTVRPASGDYVLRVPDSIRLVIRQANWGPGKIEVEGHRGEIEIAGKNVNMFLKDITGPLSANSTSGDMEIHFSALHQERPTSISNTSGFIDISLPGNSKAQFHLHSITGGIYSDIDMEIAGRTTDLTRMGGGDRVNGTMNGGGVNIRLQSISGDIFLRQK
ncbi:MAG: DUF4097 domain-containing protein [Balneolales bacterium]|nr:DUF4097 domain-containing protein [Balneolales bacterium]